MLCFKNTAYLVYENNGCRLYLAHAKSADSILQGQCLFSQTTKRGINDELLQITFSKYLFLCSKWYSQIYERRIYQPCNGYRHRTQNTYFSEDSLQVYDYKPATGRGRLIIELVLWDTPNTLSIYNDLIYLTSDTSVTMMPTYWCSYYGQVVALSVWLLQALN